EQLVLVQRGGRVDVGDHRGRDLRAVALAAGDQSGAAGDRVADGGLDPLGLGGGDEGAQPGGLQRRVAGGDGPDFGDECVEEVGVDFGGGDDALHRDADLAGVDVSAEGDRVGGGLDVGVRQDDHRAGRTQLEGQLLDP